MSNPVLARWEEPMRAAMTLAAQAEAAGDVPVGALVLDSNGEVLAQGWNMREAAVPDPTAHAEVVALRAAAAKLARWRLTDCTLLVTLEPCAMCAGAAIAARVGRVVFGAWDAKAGACGSLRDLLRDSRNNHQPEVIAGVLAAECESQLQEFFTRQRRLQH